MTTDFQIQLAAQHLRQGHVIAYPTEGVWGLGCDPLNSTAVQQLLELKQRQSNKGLILIASKFSMLAPLLAPLSQTEIKTMANTWPGPVTWLVPVNQGQIPSWLRGTHSTLAIRVSNHPVVSALSTAFQGPIVSTSANLSGQRARLSLQTVRQLFGNTIKYYLPGELTQPGKSSTIRDLKTLKIIRE